MELKFKGAKIQPAIDENDITSILAFVTYDAVLDNGFHESVEIAVFLFDTNLSVEEIEQQAIERATILLDSALASTKG